MSTISIDDADAFFFVEEEKCIEARD